MILTCPDCATGYYVDDFKIPPQGRAVKCANCGARWTAKPQAELELVATPEEGAVAVEPSAPPPPEAQPVSELPGEALPKVFRAKADTERRVRKAAATGAIWAGVAAALAVVVALAVVFRADVVRLWPRTAAAYAGVGLPVNALGLVIEGVTAEPSLQQGHAALSIAGAIRNIEDRPRTAPPLRISLLNKSGKPVATQIARPADPRIPPGQTRHFAIAMLDPPSSAHDLEVTFAPEAAPPPKKTAALPPKPKPKPKPKPAPEARKPATPEPKAPPAPAPVEARPLPADSPYALEKHG